MIGSSSCVACVNFLSEACLCRVLSWQGTKLALPHQHTHVHMVLTLSCQTATFWCNKIWNKCLLFRPEPIPCLPCTHTPVPFGGYPATPHAALSAFHASPGRCAAGAAHTEQRKYPCMLQRVACRVSPRVYIHSLSGRRIRTEQTAP
jgi:hypothetical protein